MFSCQFPTYYFILCMYRRAITLDYDYRAEPNAVIATATTTVESEQPSNATNPQVASTDRDRIDQTREARVVAIP